MLYFSQKHEDRYYASMFDGRDIHRLFQIFDNDVTEIMVSKNHIVLKQDYCYAYLYSKSGTLLDTITEKNLEITVDELELENCNGFYFTTSSFDEEIYNINTEINCYSPLKSRTKLW